MCVFIVIFTIAFCWSFEVVTEPVVVIRWVWRGVFFSLCLWGVWIELRAVILLVWKNKIWCIDRTVFFLMLFWWVGTSFCGRWGIFTGGIIGWIQSRIYIWVVFVRLLVYVMLVVLYLGSWIWWCCWLLWFHLPCRSFQSLWRYFYLHVGIVFSWPDK